MLSPPIDSGLAAAKAVSADVNRGAYTKSCHSNTIVWMKIDAALDNCKRGRSLGVVGCLKRLEIWNKERLEISHDAASKLTCCSRCL